MKATDLQIGDYVKFQGQIYIVEEISAKGWVHLIYPDTKVRVNLASDYIIDLLEPIPLTPEMLIKNGFKLTRKYILKIGTPKKQPMIAWNTWYDTPNLGIHLRSKESVAISVPCKYVHTFLRTLRLCGLDKLNKLADNFKVED